MKFHKRSSKFIWAGPAGSARAGGDPVESASAKVLLSRSGGVTTALFMKPAAAAAAP